MATAFWITTADFAGEAAKSASSVARNMPDLKRVLFTPHSVMMQHVFDRVEKLPPPLHGGWWFMDSARYFGNAVREIDDDKLIYFDSDTYMCEPIDDVLEILDNYDIAATHAPGRVTSRPKFPLPIPAAFPEVNVGVMGILRSEYTIRLMQKWYEKFKEDPAKYNNNDQGPLREVLWESERLRLYILPPEYNMRWGFGGFAKYKVKVIHGRTENPEGVCFRLNEKGGVMRGWRRGEMD